MPSSAARDAADFTAQTAALPDAFAFVRAFCDANRVASDDALRLKLVVEELFTNSVRHGYRARGGPIRIALSASADEILLVYEDEAPPFDPTSRFSTQPAAHAMPVEALPVGGLGLRLLGELALHPRYVRDGNCNRLSLGLRRTG